MKPLIQFQLQGKRALVTGAASGIGLATAQLLARGGARVAINDLPTPALDAAVAALRAEGCHVRAAAGDLSRADTARAVAEGIRARPFLRLLVEPMLSVVLFERPGWSAEDYERWSVRHAIDGDFLIVPTRWQGRPVLRTAFVNPVTQLDHALAALDTLAGDPPAV
jgi:NAD(P)-dependent dehydrogenase (short-subunit alcohol dehydrogenase family)